MLQLEESKSDRPVRCVVKSECLSEEVVSHTSHHASVAREVDSSVDEGTSCESNGEISLLLDKHSY